MQRVWFFLFRSCQAPAMSCADRNTSRPCAQSRLTARSLHRKCISGGSQPTGHPVLSPTFDVCGKTACGSGGLNLPSDSGCALMQRALRSLRASPRLLPTEPSWPPRCSSIIATAHTQRNICHGTYVKKVYVPYKNPKALKPRRKNGDNKKLVFVPCGNMSGDRGSIGGGPLRRRKESTLNKT